MMCRSESWVPTYVPFLLTRGWYILLFILHSNRTISSYFQICLNPITQLPSADSEGWGCGVWADGCVGDLPYKDVTGPPDVFKAELLLHEIFSNKYGKLHTTAMYPCVNRLVRISNVKSK